MLYQAGVDAVCRLDPRLTLRVAAFGGRWMARASEEGRTIRSLFGELCAGLPPEQRFDTENVAREMAARRMMDRLLNSSARRQALHKVIDTLEPEPMRPESAMRSLAGPCVVVTLHVGPRLGLLAHFAKAGRPSLAVLRTDNGWPPGYAEFVFTEVGNEGRTAALWTAVHYLRTGGIVSMAADGFEGGRTAPFICLGRRIALARGPFVLARLGHAALVPAASTRRPGGRIGLRLGASIEVTREPGMSDVDYESALARAAGRWFEEHILSDPAELRLHTLRWLCNYPRAAGG